MCAHQCPVVQCWIGVAQLHRVARGDTGLGAHAQKARCETISIVFESRRDVRRMLSQEISTWSTAGGAQGEGELMGCRDGWNRGNGAIGGHETQASTVKGV